MIETATAAHILTNSEDQPDCAMRFVQRLLDECRQDKGLAARLRRAENPAAEYLSWDLLVAHGVDLQDSAQRLAYITIMAAMCKVGVKKNGTLTLGRAIARRYDYGSESALARIKLRRLLACTDAREVGRILVAVTVVHGNRTLQTLDYAHVLSQLLCFSQQPETVRSQWAQEFYGYDRRRQQEAEQ